MTFGPRTPTLLYDGDCAFCRTWVEYWRKCTGPQVLYVPYQSAGNQHPEVRAEAAAKAVHFIDMHGGVTSGAEAVCALLAFAPGKKWLQWSYRRIPGFAFVSEAVYRLIASQRPLAYAVTRFFWGRRHEPSTFAIARWLYLRAVGVLFLLFFFSAAPQLPGLIGGAGIMPVSRFLSAVSENTGTQKMWLEPTLAWFASGDFALQMYAFLGGMAGLAVLVGVLTLPALLVAFICALSLIVAGQQFFAFQWDSLLLEMAFLAMLLSTVAVRERKPLTSPSKAVRWLVWLLLFRVVWSSGLVKAHSGDTSWHDLAALSYHYLTQPLPNPVAWLLYRLPDGWHRIETLGALTVELAVPFLLFFPRRLRMMGAVLVIIFQLLIAATGNFALYNLEVLALCLTCFDDRFYRKFLPKRSTEETAATEMMTPKWPTLAKVRMVAAGLGLALLFAGSGLMLIAAFEGTFVPSGVGGKAIAAVAPFRLMNPYGAFAVMTTVRQEAVIEGSEDGIDWRPYEFRYKPGNVLRPPPIVAPLDPKLDWQMWFLPFGEATDSPWFLNLLMRLLQGTPEVTALFAENPFPRDPPRYIRVNLYDYRFTTREEHMVDGAWWKRTFVRQYVPITSLESMPILYRQAARQLLIP